MSMLDLLDRTLLEQDAVLVEDIGRDNRLATAQSLAAQDQLLQAAEAAKRIWEADIYDVRAIGYLFCGAFLKEGLSALPRIARCLRRCLGENWQQLKPRANKAKHFGGAMRWFFMTLSNQLAFCKFQNNAVWQECTSSGKLVAETLAELGTLASVLAERPEVPTFLGQLQKVQELLFPHAAPPAQKSSSPAKPSSAAIEKEPTRRLGIETQGRGLQTAPRAIPIEKKMPQDHGVREILAHDGKFLSVPLSPALRELVLRIHASQELLHRKDLARAKVVLFEIERALDALMPETLLPTELCEFWSALALRAEALGSALSWAASEDRRAHLWRKLYALSPQTFAETQRLSQLPDRIQNESEPAAMELPQTESAPLLRLRESLQGATTLLVRGELERAAVILVELLPKLERFEAREYLAPLLYSCYQAQAEYAAELEKIGEPGPSLKLSALRRLCRTDLSSLLRISKDAF